ncbi:MAG: hypothetical protein ABWZ25_15025 [Chitinophagaceae bacterium]
MNPATENILPLSQGTAAPTIIGKTSPATAVFLVSFKKWVRILMLLAGALQLVFFFDNENLFAVSTVLAGWFLTDKFVLRLSYLQNYTLSTLLLLGYGITQFLLPTVFTLVEGKALVFNLLYPYEVFIHSILAFLVFIITHQFYMHWVKPESLARRAVQGKLIRLKFFKPPTNRELWIMGFIGIFGLVAMYFFGNRYSGVEDSERGGAAKIFQSLKPFAYLPYFLLLRPLFTPRPERFKVPTWSILVYTVVIIAIGIAGNSRGTFMVGVSTAAIAYFVGLLLGKFSYKIFNFRNIAMASIAFWMITGPLSDLGVAMVVVRGQRSTASNSELMSSTWEAFQDKELLSKYKIAALASITDWNEHYFDNIFLSRFCNLKFNDASLENSGIIGVDERMRKFTVDRVFAILPGPVLSAAGIDVDKDFVVSASFGDYLYFRAKGNSGSLGGFRTGHFAGTGMAAFGWWYLLFLGIGVFGLFFVFDMFVLRLPATATGGRKIYICLAGLLSCYFLFTTLASAESVASHFSYLIRGWLQLMFLYWIVYFIARRINLIFKKQY